MSYTYMGDVYNRTTPIEMTQVGPEPGLPAQPNQDECEDTHVSLHQVNKFTLSY